MLTLYPYASHQPHAYPEALSVARLAEKNKHDAQITVVNDILTAVRTQGDAALIDYTARFDGVLLTPETLCATVATLCAASAPLDANAKAAIDLAYARIFEFHQHQLPHAFKYEHNGITLEKRFTPIERVGLYVPGGTAPLLSTLLMLAIPAQLAGCNEIVLVTPPQKEKGIHPAFLYAAACCGIETLYTIGGAQAIAALAYGTETIPKVDKIFGPGNDYVTLAKRLVAQDPNGAALDMPAGPSEVLIIADDSAFPDCVAADLLAQAEHDKNAKAILFTPSLHLAQATQAAIKQQFSDRQRQNILTGALKNGGIFIAPDLATCFEWSNRYAPEHLMLQMAQPETYLPKVQHAGSVFLGPWSAEALGDYASGPNHVLPTNGAARQLSGLSVDSFFKSFSIQHVSPEGLHFLGSAVECLALIEGLDAHAYAVTLRKQLCPKPGN